MMELQSGNYYFCLGWDGHLYSLGHGDFDAAEATAESLEIDACFIFCEEIAREWLTDLQRHFDEKDGSVRSSPPVIV